jgi:hypothetical protein
MSINFKEILSGGHGNFEEQNKVLESLIIIINYCIIIMKAYYNYIISAQCNYIFLINVSSRNAKRKKMWE